MATTITYTIDHGSDHPTNQSKTTQAKAKKHGNETILNEFTKSDVCAQT